MALIDILMATYNGGNYLREQIDSILKQTESDWRLVVRDDGSNDGITLGVLDEYAARYPEKVTILDDGKGNLGPKGNFSALLEFSDAAYCTFSDQDDIWKTDKLEAALAEMKSLENSVKADVPLLVFADREIIDSQGNLLAASYWERQKQHPKDYPTFLSLLPKCIAAGSTMLINTPLREMCIPIADEARMHDTWVELVASAFGRVSYVDRVALSYRRHDKNVSGGQQSFTESRSFFARFIKLANNLDIQRTVYRINFEQAKAFRKHFEEKMGGKEKRDLLNFLKIEQQWLLGRMYTAFRYNIGPGGLSRKLAFIALSGKST